MDRFIYRVMMNTSPAERGKMLQGDLSVALWLTERCSQGLTPTQIESVAVRVVEYVRSNYGK